MKMSDPSTFQLRVPGDQLWPGAGLLLDPWDELHTTPVQYNTLQYSTLEYSTLEYSTVKYSSVLYSVCITNVMTPNWQYMYTCWGTVCTVFIPAQVQYVQCVLLPRYSMYSMYTSSGTVCTVCTPAQVEFRVFTCSVCTVQYVHLLSMYSTVCTPAQYFQYSMYSCSGTSPTWSASWSWRGWRARMTPRTRPTTR